MIWQLKTRRRGFSCLRGYYSRLSHADIGAIWGWDFLRKCVERVRARGKWEKRKFPCRGGEGFPPEMAKGIVERR